MSDMKKYQDMMGRHLMGGPTEQFDEWRDRYSTEAQKHFQRPALTCELCGRPMIQNPETGEEKLLSEWERRWSVHEICKSKAENRLDRESQMAGKRQAGVTQIIPPAETKEKKDK